MFLRTSTHSGAHRDESRLRPKNGKVRRVETLRLEYFEGDGRERRVVSFNGTIQDITERGERREKEQLFSSCTRSNHSAKNMLSVVGAITHETAIRTSETFDGALLRAHSSAPSSQVSCNTGNPRALLALACRLS
jgi:hypothetical protein